MKQFVGDFRKFILRGNVIDLAVAVVFGAAFNAVVQSFANDVLMGFVGAIFGKPNFNKVVIHVGHGSVLIGKFITTLVNFLIVGAAVFLVVKMFEALQHLRGAESEPEPEPLTRSEELLTEIRDALASQAQ